MSTRALDSCTILHSNVLYGVLLTSCNPFFMTLPLYRYQDLHQTGRYVTYYPSLHADFRLKLIIRGLLVFRCNTPLAKLDEILLVCHNRLCNNASGTRCSCGLPSRNHRPQVLCFWWTFLLFPCEPKFTNSILRIKTAHTYTRTFPLVV